MKQSTATAKWTGDLKSGSGVMGGRSGAFSDLAYTFPTRFEDAAGTNPEELIAAAHAGCFSMALSHKLDQAGMTPQSVDTTATVTLGQDNSGPAITEIHLSVKANVPGADEAQFNTVAEEAKEGCPVSKVLNAKISLETVLES